MATKNTSKTRIRRVSTYVPAQHQARIAARDAQMPEALRAVLSGPAPTQATPVNYQPLGSAQSTRGFSIFK